MLEVTSTTRPRVTPCHAREPVGGPVRVWCPTCGRSWQADELEFEPY